MRDWRSPFWSPEGFAKGWEQLAAAVPELERTEATITSWRCWTCVECQRTYGLRSILDGGGLGGFHYELAFDGTPRVLGGRTARSSGLTDRDAWDNLLRALS